MPGRPLPLTIAAGVVGLQGAALAVFAVLEVLHLTGGRATMAATTAVFFLVYAAGLLACARGLARLDSWARSPVVLTQLIQVGLAWNLRDGSTTLVSAGLLVTAVVVLVGVFHPASLRALADDPVGRT